MEVGTPAMGEEEIARIQLVRRQLPGATLMTWCRMNALEIRQSADLGMDWVDISIPASDKLRQYKLREGLPVLLERLAVFIHLAHSLGLKVCIGCEDASRASDATLHDYRPGRAGGGSRPPALCRYRRHPRPVHHRGANLGPARSLARRNRDARP
jgi:homocitrate synthase NifV